MTREAVRGWTGLVAVVLVAGGVLALLPLLVPPARAATFTLHGDTNGGWGFTPGTITSPGPTLTVSQGERVDLTLFSADSGPHTWCIDYDNDNGCGGVAENESQTFSSPTVGFPHTAFPTGAPGTYSYVCGIHSGNRMTGLFVITAPVDPTASILSPAGGLSWTGGSTQSVRWTMTDPDGPVTGLVAYVNFTAGATTVPLAGPVPGTANPHSVSVTVPMVNVTNGAINLTVIDGGGNRGWAASPIPVVDSAAPSVAGVMPPNAASNVPTATNVVITFTEAMNRTATAQPPVVTLFDVPASAYVPVTYAWSGGDTVLTLDPIADLAPLTMHRVEVNDTARDASDPGNLIASPYASVFTTATGADLIPPEIAGVAATPVVQEYPASTDLSATVTDNDAVQAVHANVRYPDASPANLTLAPVGGDAWGVSSPFSMLGNYQFRIEAVDFSGNWNWSMFAIFRVEDTTRPSIGTPMAMPAPGEVYEDVTIGVTVSDALLNEVRIDIAGVRNDTMAFNATSGQWEITFTPSLVQTYSFLVIATDTTPNLATASGTLDVQDTTPPPVPTGLVAQLAADGAAASLVWTPVSAPDLAGYRVYRATAPGGPFSPVGSLIAGATYTDTTVAAGTTYYYRVTAVDSRNLESNPSAIAQVTLPAAPADLTPYVIGGVVVAVAIAALVAFLVIRRRGRSQS